MTDELRVDGPDCGGGGPAVEAAPTRAEEAVMRWRVFFYLGQPDEGVPRSLWEEVVRPVAWGEKPEAWVAATGEDAIHEARGQMYNRPGLYVAFPEASGVTLAFKDFAS